MNEDRAPWVKTLLSVGELKPLVEQVLKLQKVNEALQSTLEPPFKGQVSASQYQQGCITLDAPHASMLTLLRYQTPDILRQLRKIQGLGGLTSIKCRIGLPSEAPEAKHVPAPIPPQPLSEAAKQILKSTALRIEDPGLQAILLQLSER